MRQDESREKFIFFGHLLLLGIAILLQAWNVFAGQPKPDFALVMLLVSAIFLDFPKIFLMILISVLFLNWQPGLNLDLAAFAFLPILTFGFKKFVPGRVEVIALISIFLGTAVFYSFTTFSVFWKNWILAGEIMFWNLVWGAVVFWLVSRFFNPTK